MVIEFQYLKPISKDRRSSTGILGAIVLRLKGLIHLLEKEDCMNSDIYINQVLKRLVLPFYNQCIKKKGYMIWIDNDVSYHTSKMTIAYRRHVGLICMDWLPQSSNVNSIENLWRIIKIQVSAQRHWIYSLESMKEVIKEEWEKLIKEDFCVCIESMPTWCKLVVEARGESIKYWAL